ncbi:MAG: thiamine pyrophosphate-binding protein [Alphaproteobacteria bacterium]|nr:MAG: thiamine pyrophosphate-binding protein [Alphaproteobacteria bacterium]
MRHGGKILIDQLEIQGATTAFTVPGESFLAALDGLHDSNRIKTIICRQEGGASMMAEAWGKITGEPGICFVTRGPGAANAMSGLHVARQDSTPMVAFVGMPSSGHEDREAFQEIEIKQVFSSFVKWAAVIRQTERIPEYVSHAIHVARSGRPGPVVLGLPEDMLASGCDAADAKPARIAESRPGAEDLAVLQDKLGKAVRPLMIIGGPGWSVAAQKAMEAFADRFDLPVAPAFRYQDYFDNRHRCYVGCAGIGLDPKLAAAIKDADVLIVLGARLGEMTTSGYTLIDIPDPKQFLVHIHPSPDELGSVYRPDLPVAATARTFCETLSRLEPPAKIAWSGRRAELRAAYEQSLRPIPLPGAVKMADVMRTVSELLPENGILTNGAGNFAAFVHRYFQYKSYRTCLAPTSGSMGYGLPAAIAAKLAHPTRPVVSVQGDGDFLMTGQELATAAQYALPIVTIIANNGMYGTIRAHQEREYPRRIVGTTLVNPDFAAYARSFGAEGYTIEATADFAPAFSAALASSKPSVIELKLDPEALSPRKTLTETRERR